MPLPEIDGARRVRRGRLRMLLILLACAAPVIASYLTYYVIRPAERTNYGTLILPTQSLPADLALATLDGEPLAPASLHGQWLLVVVDGSDCDAACEKRLFMQRQLPEMTGREHDRIDRVWLLTDGGTPAPALLEAARARTTLTVLRADPQALARWLVPAEGQALRDHLYVVDPMGEWMMRVPAEPEPSRVKRDLDKLLRASSSWDRAGR
jgi:nucleotide-binding universal stress UspA family protein